MVVAVIEAELCLFEMEIEGMFGDAVELEQASFGEAPEAFDAIDMMRSACELIVSVADPKVLVEAQIDEAIVCSPAIGMEHGLRLDSASNHRLQSGFGGIRYNLGIDLVAAFEQTEHDGLAASSTTSHAANATRTEVGFIDLHRTLERRVAFTGLSHPDRMRRKMALTERTE